MESFHTFKFNLIIGLNENNPSFIPRSCSRVQWTNEENEKIVNHVKVFGPRKWKKIACEIKTKSAQQCRDHYNDVLDPHIKNSIWTKEEEKILLLKYEQLGPRWSKIKVFLPGRTTGNIKNYLNILLKKGNTQNNEDTINIKNDLTNDIVRRSNDISYYNIESLLNHNTKF